MVDEWIYIDAAEQFARTGQLDVAPIAYATSIFEAIYGGAILRILGGSLSTLIVSTAVLGAIAGIALWDLLTRSGVRSHLAVLIVSVFLFGGVFYALSATYMTDVHALGLVMVAAALYSRGVDDQPRRYWLLAGSAAASAAYLSRPGAVAVVAGVGLIAVQKRRWSSLPWALVLPIATVAMHLVGQSTGALPSLRSDALDRLTVPSWTTLIDVATIAAISVGLWLLPLSPLMGGAAAENRPLVLAKRAVTMSGVLLLSSLLITGRLPLIGNWFTKSGMFPIDASTLGSRPDLIAWSMYVAISVVAIFISAYAVSGALSAPTTVKLRSAEVGLWAAATASLLLVILTQVAIWGRVPDRYLIVLLPAVLFSLAIRWISRGSIRFQRSSWMLIGLVATLSIALAIDGMRLQQEVFSTAQLAVFEGAELSEIDGGAAWTGFAFGLDMTPQEFSATRGRHWWRGVFAPGIEPRYEVVINPHPEDCTVRTTKVTALIGADNQVGLVDSTC